MFSATSAAARYQPRPGDAPPDVFAARMQACETCPLRKADTCRLAHQLATIIARPMGAVCPNGSWPGDPSIAAPPPPAPAGPAIRHRTIPAGPIPYAGVCHRKPWQFEVTAAIPTLNAADRLPVVIELLRMQTVRPFILIIDTGSDESDWPATQALRAADVEVHSLRLNAAEQPSEPVSMAMDVALALCRTRFMFATHDDVFLRSREALRHWRDLADVYRAAGHRLTPRPHDDWSEMFGHTALMLDVDFLLDQGITWNMRRGVRLFGIRRPARVAGMGNWPDTETGFNYLCRLAGVKPVFTGYERNYEHNIDDLIDHCRSAGGSALYNAAHADKAAAWVEQAIADAQERLAAWRLEPMKEAAPLPDERPPAVLSLPTFTPGKY